MKRLLFICICAMGLSVYAVDYSPMASSLPSQTMQSVNNTSYMSSGSTYTSAVYEVGSYSPSAAPVGGPKKAPPGTGGESTYDPNNPQFSPLGDAILPLILMALVFTGYIALRRKKRI